MEPFNFESRPSDSTYVDAIWRTSTTEGGSFMSLAETHWGLVVTQQYGETTLTVRGPETKASPSPVPENAMFFGIVFKLGTFMPNLPARILVDASVNLPEAANQSFWLNGATWELPDYDNADTFVERLVREGLLVREPVVEAALQGHVPDVSIRSVQRRFVHATGLSHGAVRQIGRAREALALLEQGTPILDVVDQAGYSDQPHLTRALKHLMGLTPTQIIRRMHIHSG